MNKTGSLESQLMDAFKEKAEKETATTAADAQKLAKTVVDYYNGNHNWFAEKIVKECRLEKWCHIKGDSGQC